MDRINFKQVLLATSKREGEQSGPIKRKTRRSTADNLRVRRAGALHHAGWHTIERI